jgi:cytochrome c oxidase subunit IV
MSSQNLTKLCLRIFIASIVIAAVMGIVAIGVPSQNWELELRIFLTTATIAGASVCGLACGGCLTRGHRILPTAGLVLTGLSACLLLAGVWGRIESENYWKTTASLSFFAVACAHLSMLFMANLAGGYRWAYLVAYPLILGLATLLGAGLVFDFFDNQGYWRLTGVISILVAAITLMIPVFHRMSRDEIAVQQANADPLFAVDEEIASLKKRLIELENKRRVLLVKADIIAAADSPAR